MNQGQREAIALAIVQLKIETEARKGIQFKPDLSRIAGAIGIRIHEYRSLVGPILERKLQQHLEGKGSDPKIHDPGCRGGIAFKILVHWIKEGEFKIHEGTSDDLEKMSKDANIPKSDIRELLTEICSELFREIYN